MLRWVLRGQAAYYVLTGVWPLLSLRTFERVTGPKTDDWLVQTVALLAAAIGLALWGGAARRPPAGEVVALAGLAAASFAGIDLAYAVPGHLPPVYLADAAAEVALLVALAAGWHRRRRDT